jgi:GT2 family glycosyltransferase
MVFNLPSTSIFIPTYNDRNDLLPCLEAMRHIDYPKEKVEIVIWDNASTDDTVQMVQRQFDEMKDEGWLGLSLIRSDKNEGSYIPYNLVLSRLSQQTQYILGMDADIELSPDTLTNLIHAAQDEDAGVVGARSVFFDNPESTAHGAGFVNRWTASYGEEDARERIKCDYVIGCCWLLKRSVFDRVGGFDPQYYINHWEVDYCLQVRDKGHNIIYEPKAVAKHKIAPTGTINRVRLYYLYRNKIILIKKLFPIPQKWIALGYLLLFSLPNSIFMAITRNRGINFEELRFICKSFVDGFRNIKGKTV